MGINPKSIIPAVLTGVGAAGAVTSLILCHRDTIKAEKLVAQLESDGVKIETKKERFGYTWKCYIPTMAAGAVTVVSIIASGYLHHNTELALLAAVAANKENVKKIEKKAKDIIGEDKVQEIKNEVIKDDISKAKKPDHPLEKGMLRLWDPYSEQWLETTPERLQVAEMTLNKLLAQHFGVGYNRFIKLLGGKTRKSLDMVGWSLDNEIQIDAWSYSPSSGVWIELYTTEMMINEGELAEVITWNVAPEDQSPTYFEG